MLKKIALAIALFAVAVWGWNTSLFTNPTPDARVKLIAHRGVHQTFDKALMDGDTCTAEKIFPPTHEFMENTLPSMRAAFDSGADVVEIDVHLTPDKQFAVFHDWTVDCRTEGNGVTEELPMAALKALDIGHGYTADGGRTFPLRGKGIGLMPTLDEVFRAFPDQKFLINFKSRRAEEGEALAQLLDANPAWRKSVFGVYGGTPPTRRSIELIDGLLGYDRESIVSCLGGYLAIGWTGMVPDACLNSLVVVPSNYAWLMWGWPHKFAERMRDAGAVVILLGPYDGGGFSAGVDEPGQANLVPEGFDGYVWTNRIEVMAPVLVAR